MTPALTLSLSAQAMHAASAVIAQQMRFADVVIDQTFSAQRALFTPFLKAPANIAAQPKAKQAAPVKKKLPKAAAAKKKVIKAKAPKTAKKTKSVVAPKPA
ncbi:MAG: hypothetical protein NWP79_00255, partial [Paracoccaceae bacterium]|nr:hypothetical protein [Paracoccaceae bacterium]